jgi:hypothetical protein
VPRVAGDSIQKHLMGFIPNTQCHNLPDDYLEELKNGNGSFMPGLVRAGQFIDESTNHTLNQKLIKGYFNRLELDSMEVDKEYFILLRHPMERVLSFF